jgi:hypothetical protein
MPVLRHSSFIKVTPDKTDNLLWALVEGLAALFVITPFLTSLALSVDQSLLIQQVHIHRQSALGEIARLTGMLYRPSGGHSPVWPSPITRYDRSGL